MRLKIKLLKNTFNCGYKRSVWHPLDPNEPDIKVFYIKEEEMVKYRLNQGKIFIRIRADIWISETWEKSEMWYEV